MGFKRVTKSNVDQGSVGSIEHSPYSGAERNAEVGNHLKPIPTSDTTWTTNCSTVKGLSKKGYNLAVYNNSSSVGSITLGSDASVTSQAPGAVEALTGNVGIACPANSWTMVACWDKQWVISSASTILVYLIADDSSVVATSNTSST